MAATHSLPFRRGDTWKDGFTSTTAGANNGLPGQIFYATDMDAPAARRHVLPNTSVGHTELIVLRNRTGATIKRGGASQGAAQIRECSRLWIRGTMSSAFGAGAINTVGGFGARAYALDDAMATSKGVAVGDDAYFIRRGLCRLTLRSGMGTATPGVTKVICRTGGLAGRYVGTGRPEILGVFLETVAAATGFRTVLCLLGSEFANSDGTIG